jgi:hypothetical protein
MIFLRIRSENYKIQNRVMLVIAVKPNVIPAKESVCALKLLMLKSIQDCF